MTSRDTNDERWLTESEATDSLRRASQLDAGDAVKLRHLREAAVESGLSLEAVDAATNEMANGGTGGTPPVWVRFNLAGIPIRAGAWFFGCSAAVSSAIRWMDRHSTKAAVERWSVKLTIYDRLDVWSRDCSRRPGQPAFVHAVCWK